MIQQILLGLLSFVLCFVFTPVCRNVALRLGLVDRPDSERKHHTTAVPRVGGFAIVLAYATSLGVMMLSPDHQRFHIQHQELLKVLLPPAAMIFLVGLLDDLISLTAFQKLIGQIIACFTAAILGSMYAPESFSFGTGGGWITIHPWVSIAICAFWLVLCTNAINLIDGLDGLASGVGLMGTVATLLIGVYTHNTGLVVATVPLAGALLAFLYYNFNPASIFLGDCGSLTIGFMLGAISLTWEHHDGLTLGMLAPITVLAFPLLDVGTSITRRYLRSKPLFSPDRGHIHHMVQDRGNKPKTAALILYGACAIAATVSVLSSIAPKGLRAGFMVLFGILLFVAVRYLDYIEFRALARVLSSRRMRQQVNEEIYIRELEIALGKVETVNDCWKLVEQSCKELHFATVEMYFQNLYFDTVLQEDVSERDWWLSLPLGEHGYLRVSRSNLLRVGPVVMPALDQLQRGLDKWERTSPVETRVRPPRPQQKLRPLSEQTT